ncbi:MAG: hypothetical protein H7645_00490 [Candidatus Heimdallarchaeota archaeon]|nr:hypothetical protein [Candidatus Heimdallarchaeota archaeon]MCK4768791.1 hypothetical protein [Candidatus Heimdallarchaeota archaeon]
MTTITNKIHLEPLTIERSVIETPLFLINGKLRRLDWRKNQHHFFRFLEELPKILRRDVPENVFNEVILHYQNLNNLLLESHLHDESFNNGNMLIYFLALLEHHTTLHGREIQFKNLRRIFRLWGIDDNFTFYLRRIAQARERLETAELLKFDPLSTLDDIQKKINHLIDYLSLKLPVKNDDLERIRERVTKLLDKRIIPYASIQDAGLTMIVASFPEYLEIPALKLYFLLNLRKEFKVDLNALRKRVQRYRERLKEKNL